MISHHGPWGPIYGLCLGECWLCFHHKVACHVDSQGGGIPVSTAKVAGSRVAVSHSQVGRLVV